MTDNRADPDELLKEIQAHDRESVRGQLKIYLGSAPGVGKTYKMLHDARDLVKKGVDLVIGLI